MIAQRGSHGSPRLPTARAIDAMAAAARRDAGAFEPVIRILGRSLAAELERWTPTHGSMSVQVLCPACGYVSELHRPPVTECARCHTALPEPLRESAERALKYADAPMPMLLVIGQWLSLITGGMFVFLTALAPFDLGTFSISGEEVPGPVFLQRGGWLMGVVGVILIGIAYGLWRERPWARGLMILYWLALTLLAFVGDRGEVAALVVSGLIMLCCIGAAAWYLFGKDNVRAYFETRAATSSERGD